MFAPLALLLIALADDPPRQLPIDRHGVVELAAARAELQGERLRLVDEPAPGYVGRWDDPGESVAWAFDLPKTGRYLVVVEYAAPAGPGAARFEVAVAGQRRQAFANPTGSETTFLPQPLLGPVDLEAGPNRLVVRALEAPPGGGPILSLRRVRLVPDAP